MKSGFQAATGPSLPWPGKERAGAERSAGPYSLQHRLLATVQSRHTRSIFPALALPPTALPVTEEERVSVCVVRLAEARQKSQEAKLRESWGSARGPL